MTNSPPPWVLVRLSVSIHSVGEYFRLLSNTLLQLTFSNFAANEFFKVWIKFVFRFWKCKQTLFSKNDKKTAQNLKVVFCKVFWNVKKVLVVICWVLTRIISQSDSWQKIKLLPRFAITICNRQLAMKIKKTGRRRGSELCARASLTSQSHCRLSVWS